MGRRLAIIGLVLGSLIALSVPVVVTTLSTPKASSERQVTVRLAEGTAPGQPAHAATGRSTRPSSHTTFGHPAAPRPGSRPARGGGGTTRGGKGGQGSTTVQGNAFAAPSGGGSGAQYGSSRAPSGTPASASDASFTRPSHQAIRTEAGPAPTGLPMTLSAGGPDGLGGLPVPVPSVSLPSVPSLPHVPNVLPKTKAPRLSNWIATCNPGKPGKVGTAPFNVFWQHSSYTPIGAFNIGGLNYPCGPDWAIIPGSSPIVPPVWIGKSEPFQPPTNVPGGFIFGTAQDIDGLHLAQELAAAGVPIVASGQILGAGADGAVIYTTNWWTLSPQIKNAAATIMQKHGAYPGAIWETDPLHWGYGNIGVGLPNNIKMK